ncbi:unnamed protein product [Closterium sp. Yama58-4]|nr:unnamed protein product [Closterium sp. Yama58-4]
MAYNSPHSSVLSIHCRTAGHVSTHRTDGSDRIASLRWLRPLVSFGGTSRTPEVCRSVARDSCMVPYQPVRHDIAASSHLRVLIGCPANALMRFYLANALNSEVNPLMSGHRPQSVLLPRGIGSWFGGQTYLGWIA